VPVVASSLDASREAVRDGALGEAVDPDDPESVRRGILRALAADRGVPEGLAYFSFERFEERWHGVITHVFGNTAGPATRCVETATASA
jgi:glycosyltransferase involved in cell wall biosynthesis